MLSRGGGTCHPSRRVVSDDNDDKLFTERAKELREICMKERAGATVSTESCTTTGSCEHTRSRQAVNGKAGCLDVSISH